jgi:predicted Zn finger-like uncharacterized protein
MILTCPECATSYFIDDGRIPADGRKVKCSSCGHRWLATPDGSAEATAEPEAPPLVEPAPEPSPGLGAVPEDDLVIAAAEPGAPVEPKRPVRRAPPSAKGDGRSSALVWAGAAALAAALIAGVIVFREQVVRLWPASSAAYAGLGFAVDGGGLVLEQVHVEPAFAAGKPVLSVTGAIRNVRDVPLETPPVRVTLLNRAGKPVAAKIARPVEATVPAGAKRHFAIAIADPPATARDLEVRFVTGKEAKSPAAHAAVARGAAETAREAAEPADAHSSPAAATERG